MLEFLRRSPKVNLDKMVLRKNDISLLILDERWNKLFLNTQKTPQIAASEEKLKALLKEEARLIAEARSISASKKMHMDKIIKLTPAVFEKNDSTAIKEMEFSEKEIKRINERAKKIEDELDAFPERKRETNLELLKNTVKVVYFKMQTGKKKGGGTGKAY